jgi:hypothetical protein
VVAYAALLVVIGTMIQAYLHMLQVRDERRDLGDWLAADILRREVGFWHPIRRYRRGREVSKLLAADPALRSRIRRVEWSLRSWELLVLASLLFVLQEWFGFGA